MKTLKLLFFLCTTYVFAQVPANNECSNAELITISTTELTLSVDFTEATESLDASCNISTSNNRDVWFKFVMPINGNLYINPPSSLNYFTLYNTCGGAEIACSNGNTVFDNLISGNTYLLRTSYQFNGLSTFKLQAFLPADNDECAARETITVQTSNYIEYAADSRTASESQDVSCEVDSNNNLDLWYEFVMPVNGNIEITEARQFQYQTYTFFDGCGGEELKCIYDRGFFENLTAGSTYVLRVADRIENAGPINFRIQAFEYATNNNCNSPETIVVETASNNTYISDFRTASESLNATCEDASNTNYDLWYNFTMPVTGNLKIDQIGNIETITLYDSCGDTEIHCESGLQFVSGLIENTSYLLRIGSVSPSRKSPRFRVFPTAVNDDCETSETIIIETDNTLSFQVDTRTATESLNSSCDNSNDNNLDLWYDFVMPVTGNIQISNVGFDLRTTLYDACSGNELGCFYGNGSYLNLGLNSSYKLRVSQLPNTARLNNINIQPFENLFNDDCATPQHIIIPTDAFAKYSTNNAAATNSELAACEPSSDSFIIQDVWYRFTMPNDKDIEINHLTASINGYYSLYDLCGTTELQCFTNDGFFTNLTEGQEYLLKVGKLSSQAGEFSFNIVAIGVGLSTNEVSLENVKMYPNPVIDEVQLSLTHPSIIKEVRIYNVSGQLIKNVTNSALKSTFSINTSSLKSMLYFVEISSDNGQIVRKMVKK